MRCSIRRATGADARALTALALRSKASWGYDDAFMRLVAPLLDFEAVAIDRETIYLAESGGELLGFYRLSENAGRQFLDDLWIDPPHIGRGIGRYLWNHACETARTLGWRDFEIESDPFAEAFYLRMGATRTGTRRSPTGRDLPLLLARLEPTEASDPSQHESRTR